MGTHPIFESDFDCLTDRMSQLSGVEVRATSGAWQPGCSILNYNPDGETITVGFQDDFNRTQEVPIGDVRFAAPASDSETQFNEGDDVEILWKSKSDSPAQWYPGKVRNCKGGFYVCEFVHFGQAASDVFEGQSLRQPNTNPCLSSDDFFKAEVEIPQELHEFCQTHSDAHRDFQKACEAMTIQYMNGRLIILSRKNISRRVDMIKEFHIKNLAQKMKLAERLTECQVKLEQSKLVAESSCEKFKVDSDLLKFVVGTKGANITKARSIPGVIQIHIDDENQMVHIYAETPEAAKKSRLLLEFTEEHYLVPRNLVGRIIGQKGKSIQDIIDKSHVLKVRVLSEEDAKAVDGASDPAVCAFKFIGTRVNNQNAKALMDYLVQSLKQIDELQDEQKEIEQQIGNYNTFHGSSYSINGNNHGSSGYSSDNRENHYKNRRPKRDGEHTDSETESNRNGKGNYRGRNQKSRESRIEEYSNGIHQSTMIEQRDVKRESKQRQVNRYELLEDVSAISQGVTFGDDWSEVSPKKDYGAGEGSRRGRGGAQNRGRNSQNQRNPPRNGPKTPSLTLNDFMPGPYARAAAGMKGGAGDKKN